MPKSNTKKSEYWEEKINEYKKSGTRMSQSKWCKENKLSLRRFNYWYCKLKKNDKENKEDSANYSKKDENTNNQTKWIPIRIEGREGDREEEKEGNQNKTGIIINIGKAKIEINKGFDSESLHEVVKVVNLLC